MANKVIDTNVPIVANGGSDGVCPDCQKNAIKFLMEVLSEHRVVLDVAGECQQEYHRYLNPQGQPSVGDLFYKSVLLSDPSKIVRVAADRDTDGNFTALSPDINNSGFDLSDRKFAALSVLMNAPVANCVDSDWVIFEEVLVNGGVSIDNLCGSDPALWRSPEQGAEDGP